MARAARSATATRVAEAEVRQQRERDLVTSVIACTACSLATGRGVGSAPVVGEGPLDADLVVVASVPRAHEELQGRALAGGARNLLDHSLERVGLDPGAVRITSAVRCRPVDDRAVTPAEVAACATHLHAELELVAPRVVVSLGAVAAAAVLRRPLPLARAAGYRLEALDGAATLVPTYDPAAIVRGDRVGGGLLVRHLAVAAAVLEGRLISGAQALADARAAAQRPTEEVPPTSRTRAPVRAAARVPARCR
jgi:uracil-DNA glycosylase family 4